jgi:hypothetical protein
MPTLKLQMPSLGFYYLPSQFSVCFLLRAPLFALSLRFEAFTHFGMISFSFPKILPDYQIESVSKFSSSFFILSLLVPTQKTGIGHLQQHK